MPRILKPLKALVHQVRVRPRLTLAATVALAARLTLPASLAGPTRALIAWDLGTGLYLVLAWSTMLASSRDKMRWRARLQDDGAVVVLGLTVIAGLASLAAIALELGGLKGLAPDRQTLHLGLAGITILFSWAFIHTAFALHYAHEFYAEHRDDGRRGLDFPGNQEPGYVDFLYFSFVIGTTSQTADVTISSSYMRRLALAQGVVAFFFNTTLLALTINIAAGLI